MSEDAVASAGHSGERAIVRWLTIPWVDRSLAIIAVLPFAYPIALHLKQHRNLAELFYLAQTLLLIGTMVFRRPAVRITIDPLDWVLASVAAYWGLLTLSLEQAWTSDRGVWIALPVAVTGGLIQIWARLSLGRSIGLVPAQREIVEWGAYRWVRHPIYTAFFFATVAAALESYTPRNLIIYLLGAVWFIFRSFAEEDFLRKDTKYSNYMQRVRWRWIPGLI